MLGHIIFRNVFNAGWRRCSAVIMPEIISSEWFVVAGAMIGGGGLTAGIQGVQ